MPPVKHALLGASGAHRWLECTPSALWESRIGHDTTSEAAAEGTLAHEIAENHLRNLLAGKKATTPKKLKSDPLYKPVMQEYIAVYTGYIMEHFTEARVKTPDAILMQEERVDYSDWVEGGFGTADCLLIADRELQVFDLKYGKGVPVDAVGNPQLRLYALGAWAAYSVLYDIDRVTYHIIQPRLDSITCETMTVPGLLDWAENYVKPRAELAAKGEGIFVPGDHCKWCKAQNRCRAFADKQLEISTLRYDEDDNEVCANELTNAEISEILLHVDGLTRWAKGIKDWALEQAVNFGTEFPGFKVVEGRSVRCIKDEAAVIEKLDAIGITADRVTKLVGIGELEEIVGKSKLSETLGDLIVKPQGKPTLVKESDKRPALTDINRASTMFDMIKEDN